MFFSLLRSVYHVTYTNMIQTCPYRLEVLKVVEFPGLGLYNDIAGDTRYLLYHS